MKKVKAFEGNGKYERIWWYWQSKKEYVGVCNPKKNPSTMSRRNQGTRHERTKELVILKPKQDSPNKNMAMQEGFEPPTPHV
jgi:hypothetical protein